MSSSSVGLNLNPRGSDSVDNFSILLSAVTQSDRILVLENCLVDFDKYQIIKKLISQPFI